MTVTVVTKQDLLQIREYEKKNKVQFNQELTDEFVDNMADQLRLPIHQSFIHNDDHMRAVVVVNEEGSLGLVDMPFEIYDKLQEVVIDDNE